MAQTGSGAQLTHTALLVAHTPTELQVPHTCQSELDRAGLAGERGVQLVGWNRPAALKCQLAAASLQSQTESQLTAVSRVLILQHSFALVVRLHCDTACAILGHQSVLSWRSAQLPLPFCCSCPDTACSNSLLQKYNNLLSSS